MDPYTVALFAVAAAGLVKGIIGALDDTAERKAALMRQEAGIEQSNLNENMRRMEGQQTQVLSSTQARMAATGFSSTSGSFKGYLSGMADQFKMQDQFQATQGQDVIKLQEQGADIMNDAGLAKWVNFGSSVVGAAGTIAGATKGSV